MANVTYRACCLRLVGIYPDPWQISQDYTIAICWMTCINCTVKAPGKNVCIYIYIRLYKYLPNFLTHDWFVFHSTTLRNKPTSIWKIHENPPCLDHSPRIFPWLHLHRLGEAIVAASRVFFLAVKDTLWRKDLGFIKGDLFNIIQLDTWIYN